MYFYMLLTFFSYVDRIVWVKRYQGANDLVLSTGHYILHSTELCLIGAKYGSPQTPLQFLSKATNDVIFSTVGEQPEKPKEIYEIIEALMPGAKKIELFASNNRYRHNC